MFIRIEASSAIPIYRQIIDQIREQVAVGILKAGEQVPSVRQLAAELAVNQNTILKVYNELTGDGLLKVERGSGTFVTDGAGAIQEKERTEIVQEAIGQVVEKGLRMQVSLEQMQDYLEAEYQNRTKREESSDE